MATHKWGIRRVVSTGLGIEFCAVVESVDVREAGTFDSNEEAYLRARELGDSHFAWPHIAELCDADQR